MKIEIHKEVEIEPTIRTELLSSLFEVPTTTKLSVSLTGNLTLEERPWNIGLIVGPSGSGKTLLLNELFGHPEELNWKSKSVIDDFPQDKSMEEISRVCQSVGFNTIPSWLRPFSVLSNGERFRAEVARRLLWPHGIISIDEFTSVVDRQVAQFACHSIQKYIRGCEHKQLVVASCHYDILDWLQPDWILEPGNPCRFTWRSLRSRPPINAAVSRVQYETWKLFAPFHYMSAELNKAARCYGLYVASSELSTGMEFPIHDIGIRTLSNECNDSSGFNNNIRIPSRLSLHGRPFDSRMVLHEDDRIESECSSAKSVSSFENEGEPCPRPPRSSHCGLREGLGRRANKDESVHQLSTEETGPTTESMETETKQDGCFGSSTATASLSESNNVRDRLSENGLRRPNWRDSDSSSSYRIASMCGVLYRPHPKVRDIMGFTRMVTLPDYQGLGLAFVLANTVASAYKALGRRLHSYPNHPAWIRSYQRSKDWMQVKEAGSFSPRRGESSTVGGFGGRRCAVFQYIGSPMNKEEAERLINVED